MSSENRVLDHIFLCQEKATTCWQNPTLDKSFDNQNLDFFLKNPMRVFLHRGQGPTTCCTERKWSTRNAAAGRNPLFLVGRWLPFFINLPYFWGTALVGRDDNMRWWLITHLEMHMQNPISQCELDTVMCFLSSGCGDGLLDPAVFRMPRYQLLLVARSDRSSLDPEPGMGVWDRPLAQNTCMEKTRQGADTNQARITVPW